MKIQPQHAPMNPTYRPLQTSEPARPFQSFLEASPGRFQGDGGAKAFSEAGLFGASDGGQAPIEKQVVADGPADELAQPLADPTLAAQAPACLPLEPSIQVADVTAVCAALHRPSIVLGQKAHAPLIEGLSSPPTSVSRRSEPLSDSNRRSAPAAKERPPAGRPKAQTSLIVSEADGQLEIVAAAPGLNREAGERLRKLMSELVAQFGLNLTELQLNGAQIEKPLIGPVGAPYGR